MVPIMQTTATATTTQTVNQLAFEASELFQGKPYRKTFLHQGELFHMASAQRDREGELLFIRYRGTNGTAAIVFND